MRARALKHALTLCVFALKHALSMAAATVEGLPPSSLVTRLGRPGERLCTSPTVELERMLVAQRNNQSHRGTHREKQIGNEASIRRQRKQGSHSERLKNKAPDATPLL